MTYKLQAIAIFAAIWVFYYLIERFKPQSEFLESTAPLIIVIFGIIGTRKLLLGFREDEERKKELKDKMLEEEMLQMLEEDRLNAMTLAEISAEGLRRAKEIQKKRQAEAQKPPAPKHRYNRRQIILWLIKRNFHQAQDWEKFAYLLIPLTMLFLLLSFGDWPYGFYTILRFLTTLSLLELLHKRHRMWLRFTALLLIILYNPIAPVKLERDLWGHLNILLLLLLPFPSIARLIYCPLEGIHYRLRRKSPRDLIRFSLIQHNDREPAEK